ncbi:MAG TPA: MBL fold metallo-hydrolase [Polyangiaceae bacterium]|nr:MBL fold metallo-hydrolase [Polyangiaceae bacterium]
MTDRSRSLVGLLFAAVCAWLSAGCATRYDRVTLGNLEVHTFTRGHANVHVLVEDGRSLAVDSGLARNAPELDADMRAAGLDPRKLGAMVLTHGHADHAGGARYFQQRYGTRVVAGEGDRAMLARGTNDPLCPTGALARMRTAEDLAETFSPTRADVWVTSPTSLFELTGVHARVVPVPGHTPGSLAVVAGTGAFVGDLLRGGLVGTGAELHFYMCNVPGNARDIGRLLAVDAPRATTLFVGHFGPVTRDEAIARFLE